MRLTPHVAMLSLEREAGGTLHPTLLWDANHVILVDCGFPGQLEQIEQALRAEGFDPGQLTRLIFTHGDVDHVGCARELLAMIPNLETLAHEIEAPAIDGSGPPPKIAHRKALNRDDPAKLAELEGFEARYKADYAVPVARTLADGERLPCCGGIRIIHTPGHTDGHICLYLEAHRVLITGDGINGALGKLAGPNPVHTIDMALARASIARLAGMDLPIEQVISYHGGRITGDIGAQLLALGQID